ncbi:restriction endonuclease [Gulosibacter sp. GYB002]|uniref:restriction endonuclease n=1 Tax=Gulosibacter sp. GYB002 TaxID=2994391 RepID=UPI002F96671C
MSTDNTPTIDQFRPVVLQVLSDGQEYPLQQVCQLVADHMGLSDEVRAETVPSGQRRYVNRIAWACSGLFQAELLTRPKRGHYRITDDGRTVASRRLTEYSEKDMHEWPSWRAYQEEIAARKHSTPNEPDVDYEEGSNPVELMSLAERSFNAQTETTLRKRLQQASPEFFEKAVIDLLWAMGYGGTHGEKQHVGRSGDGGIDGVIRQDALGLTNVYIQAKRYADTNKVGDPEIRNFIGSLDAQGANLGVFFTTSSFLPSAVRTADRYRHGRIILIDGIKLTNLMLTYGVAVHMAQSYTLYEIDDDFFEDDVV